jgi:cardiolipin synthase
VTRRPPAWLPNAITVLRVALVPVFLWLAWPRPDRPLGHNRVVATLVLSLIGASDLVDGYLARRFGLGSRLGAILDAAADKLAQVAVVAFFTLVVTRLPVWFLGLLVGRDLLVGTGTLALAKRRPGARMVHRIHGKAASSVLFVLMLSLAVGLEGGPWITTLFWATAFLVAVSTVGYIYEGVSLVREPLGRSARTAPRRG